MAELFEKRVWTGEFFVPDAYDDRFVGELEYSPNGGVVLSYFIQGNEVPNPTGILHGILSSGDKCTLIGCESLGRSGFFMRNGMCTRQGKIGLPLLAVGEFLSQDATFNNLDFTLTNLQEFFYATGFKDNVKFSDKPIYGINTAFGRLEVGNTATFGALSKDITTQIHSRDSMALTELKETFRSLEHKYPKALFMLKKDISYRVYLKFEPELSIRAMYDYVTRLSDLFALMTYGPVHPDSLQLLINQTNGDPSIQVTLYPSILLDQRTVDLATRSQSHHNMPINVSNSPFNEVVSNWLAAPNIYSSVIAGIQYDTGFRDIHTAQADIIIYATQLESISYTDGYKKEKYEYPFRAYGTDALQQRAMRLFGVSSLADAAIGIADLRNEIAHVNRPKKWLTSFSLGQLADLGQILQLVVLGYILRSVGIPEKVVLAYQCMYAPAV